MGENSKIEWCDHTFNPWIGCTKVSAACDHCYAEPMATNRLGVAWGPGAPRRRTAASTWKQPLAWDRKAAKEGRRARVFCASLADVFDAEVDEAWRDDLFALIDQTPNLDWLLLTKRPAVARKVMPERPRPNVWLGVTVEDQKMADLRIPLLLETPAAVRFLSMEPLLGPVDMKRWLPGKRAAFRPGGEPFLAPHWYMTRCEYCGWVGSSELCGSDLDDDILCGGCHQSICGYELPSIDWVITGGESGPGARPSHPDWFRSIRDQCEAADVPFFFKQWGEFQPFAGHPIEHESSIMGTARSATFSDGQVMIRVGKKPAGRVLDGVEHNGVPQIGTGEG